MSNPLDGIFGGGNGLIGKIMSIAGAADKIKTTVADIASSIVFTSRLCRSARDGAGCFPMAYR